MSDTLSVAETAKIIETIREEFRFSHDGEEPQRRNEDEDLRFQIPEMQWDEAAAASRRGGTQNGVTVLPRPMLSISKIDQPIRLIMNQAHAAKLGINIHPVSEQATDDTAEVLQDLIRRIERDSNANVARLWALDRAVKAGRGVYRVNVRPDEDGFAFGDLEVGIERILHQGCVYFDPSAQLPDYSDGDFAYVTSWMLLSKAVRLYRGARAMQATSEGITWANMAKEAPLWVRTDGAGKSIQVAERFWKKHTDELLLILDNGRTVIDGTGKVSNGRKVLGERVRDRVEVWHCVTDGYDILEQPQQWLGKYIPLIPVLGRELQPFDEQRRIIGIIRNARDPQRFFNTSASTLMERMFMEPRSPWVMAEGQDEGREEAWAKANLLSIPVLKYKPTGLKDGTPAPPPFRAQLDQTGMSIALMALQEATLLCQDATAFFDPSLGKTSRQEESGRKVLALQGQGDAANGDWLEQLAVAMRYEALCVVDLIAPADPERQGVYDAPGRITTVLGGEPEKARQVMLNRAFVPDPRTGKPVPARRGQKGAKHYDLKSGARYGVSVTIGTSFKTRLQEGDEAITRIIEADPTLLSVIGDLLFAFKDIPGHKEISERLLLLAQSQHPELFKKDDSPEQAAAKAKALEQQVQVLGQKLQEAVQYIQTDQGKHQAAVSIAQFKAEADKAMRLADIASKERMAHEANATKILVARLSTDKETDNLRAEAEEELLATGIKVRHEAEQGALDREHKTQTHREEMAHDVAMAAAGAHTTKVTRDRGQEAGQEQTDETSSGGSESSTPPADGGAA